MSGLIRCALHQPFEMTTWAYQMCAPETHLLQYVRSNEPIYLFHLLYRPSYIPCRGCHAVVYAVCASPYCTVEALSPFF